MADSLDLKQIEQRIWARHFRDGLWDIFIGCMLLAAAVGTLIDGPYVSTVERLAVVLIIIIAAAAGLWIAKRTITQPRLGYVSHNPRLIERSKWAGRLYILMTILNSILLVVARGSSLGASGIGDTWYPVAFAILILIFTGIVAFLLEYERLYVIAFECALPWPLREMAPPSLRFLPFALSAAAVIIMGVIVFINFLNHYPVIGDSSPLEEGWNVGG